MKVKYIIVDLDQTLLKTDKTISDYTKEVINKLRNKGFIFCFNTARSYLSSLPFIEEMQPDYSILNGGALILDKNKKIVYQKLISKDTVNYILAEAKLDPQVLNYSIEGETGLYSNNLERVKANPLAIYDDFKNGFKEGAYKFLISATNPEKWQEMAKDLKLYYEPYFSGTWARFSPSTKYLGNLALFELLKDDKPEDYTFGDDNGDALMIDKAYHGVYLANTNPSLLKEGSRLTKDDYDNDGVAKYLSSLFLES